MEEVTLYNVFMEEDYMDIRRRFHSSCSGEINWKDGEQFLDHLSSLPFFIFDSWGHDKSQNKVMAGHCDKCDSVYLAKTEFIPPSKTRICLESVIDADAFIKELNTAFDSLKAKI